MNDGEKLIKRIRSLSNIEQIIFSYHERSGSAQCHIDIYTAEKSDYLATDFTTLEQLTEFAAQTKKAVGSDSVKYLIKKVVISQL